MDYANPGAILKVDRHGRVVWRYAPRSGRGRLDHPSLAIELANGLVAVNDDFRHRVLVIDPKTNRIVWQYGHTDHHGRGKEHLYHPGRHHHHPAIRGRDALSPAPASGRRSGPARPVVARPLDQVGGADRARIAP